MREDVKQKGRQGRVHRPRSPAMVLPLCEEIESLLAGGGFWRMGVAD